MPVLTKELIEAAKVKAGIPAEMVEEYKKFIEDVEKSKERGVLTFGKNEDVKVGRKALIEAGIQLKKYIAVRKVRGADNVLKFERISKREFDEAKKKVEARAAKLRGKPRKKAAGKKK